MKITTDDLTEMLFTAYKRGSTAGLEEGSQRVTESTRALVQENSQLKGDLDVLERKLHVKDQKDCFADIRKERIRIVAALNDYLAKTGRTAIANEGIFALALGGL